MQIIRLIGAAFAGLTLLVGSAAAQDEQLQSQVQELQSSYEEAWIAGDADALASLFTDDAVLWPLSGGSFEGREQIRQALEEELPPQSASIRSVHTEQIGDRVFDVGTFSMTMPENEAGAMAGATLEGEYVVMTEETEDGMRISRLIAFQPRRPPEQQQ